jgi:2-C-methyl-D-erythritol 2,4-cyclodiphosphate synthase
MRVGIGFDIHSLAEGRRLVLGGVEFEGEVGLQGHSDADVVIHAVIDALLGAVALGDIGQHFPDDDERDVSVVAERPRLSPKVEAMRGNLAAVLGIGPEFISIKATTAEKLGTIGRAEGIAAWAVALVDRVQAPDLP